MTDAQDLAGLDNDVVTPGFRGTWRQLPELELPPVCVVLVGGGGGGGTGAEPTLPVDGLTLAAQAARTALQGSTETLITVTERLTDELRAELAADGFSVVTADSTSAPARARAPAPGRIWLLTSGSTGRPKRVAHSGRSLTTVLTDQPPRRWLCPYLPGSYAWWQVVTLSASRPGQGIVFVDPTDVEQWPRTALAEQVTAISGTPTFWRQALWRSGPALARLPLEQVTLGGEPVDQDILDRLRRIYPDARITWIYASSEAGAAIAVHDGRAGFPRAWLDRDHPGRSTLSLTDGELTISSRWRADGLGDQPLRTGDRAEVIGDRVHILGRVGLDEINVGGAKVSAGAVRAILLDHPDVAWAAVKGRRAPLVGEVVTAELVVTDPVDPQRLTAWCRERLPEQAVPRRFRFLDEIPIKETLKSDV